MERGKSGGMTLQQPGVALEHDAGAVYRDINCIYQHLLNAVHVKVQGGRGFEIRAKSQESPTPLSSPASSLYVSSMNHLVLGTFKSNFL